MSTLFPEITTAQRVFNRRDKNTPADAVYVGRPSTWGNPYPMKDHSESERNRVCDLFDTYAIERRRNDPTWLLPLKGKSLVCYCAPARCHADTLLRLANEGCATQNGDCGDN